jgi:hypothetical protein
MLTSYIPSRDASLISSIRFELSALRHPKSKPCATGNILKTKGQRGPEPILNWRNEVNLGESGDSGEYGGSEQA